MRRRSSGLRRWGMLGGRVGDLYVRCLRFRRGDRGTHCETRNKYGEQLELFIYVWRGAKPSSLPCTISVGGGAQRAQITMRISVG